jgi:hypothetical protein
MRTPGARRTDLSRGKCVRQVEGAHWSTQSRVVGRAQYGVTGRRDAHDQRVAGLGAVTPTGHFAQPKQSCASAHLFGYSYTTKREER